MSCSVLLLRGPGLCSWRNLAIIPLPADCLRRFVQVPSKLACSVTTTPTWLLLVFLSTVSQEIPPRPTPRSRPDKTYLTLSCVTPRPLLLQLLGSRNLPRVQREVYLPWIRRVKSCFARLVAQTRLWTLSRRLLPMRLVWKTPRRKVMKQSDPIRVMVYSRHHNKRH
jgi:hypothetical protein